MPRVLESEPFPKATRKLPKSQQEKLGILIELLKKDPNNSLLHTKRLSGKMSGWSSFRIARDYRVTFRYLSEDTIMLLQVAHRTGIYR